MGQGVMISQELIEQKKIELGLNAPFYQQYLKWFSGVMNGDLGVSYNDGSSVFNTLIKHFKHTVLLSLMALIVVILIAFPLGILSALNKDSVFDHIIRVLTALGNCIPNFLFCVLLIFVFCIQRKWLPILSQNSFKGLVLPTTALALPVASRLTRQIRVEILEEMEKPYVSQAINRGVRFRFILFYNVLHNAMPSFLTLLGLSVGGLLGGSVIIESIFRWPGVGHVVMEAIMDRDYPVIQGFVLLMTGVYLMLHLLIDIGHRFLDPRKEG